MNLVVLACMSTICCTAAATKCWTAGCKDTVKVQSLDLDTCAARILSKAWRPLRHLDPPQVVNDMYAIHLMSGAACNGSHNHKDQARCYGAGTVAPSKALPHTK
jgi:hypothetical protein